MKHERAKKAASTALRLSRATSCCSAALTADNGHDGPKSVEITLSTNLGVSPRRRVPISRTDRAGGGRGNRRYCYILLPTSDDELVDENVRAASLVSHTSAVCHTRHSYKRQALSPSDRPPPTSFSLSLSHA